MAEKVKQPWRKIEADALTFGDQTGEATRYTLAEDVLKGAGEPEHNATNAILWAIMLDHRELLATQMQLTKALLELFQRMDAAGQAAMASAANPAEDLLKSTLQRIADAAPDAFPPEVLKQFGITPKPQPDLAAPSNGSDGE